MGDEFVIKTETIKKGDLTEREKQIYDWGYSDGQEAQKLEWRLVGGLVIVLVIIFGLLYLAQP